MDQASQVTKEISLIEIFYELKKKKYVLLVFVLIALLGVVGYKVLAHKKYTHQSSFTFLVSQSTNNRSLLLGNSSVLNNENVYLDINLFDENNSINTFRLLSPNSYGDILNSDSALLYFSKIILPGQKQSLLDSLKQIPELNSIKNQSQEDEFSEASLVRKYFKKKNIFTTKYTLDKNVLYVSVSAENKNISKCWSILSTDYLTKYIQNIQKQKSKEQLIAIEKAIQANKIVSSTEDKKLYVTIEKILTKQLYESKLKEVLATHSPFNIIATTELPGEKLSTPILLILAVIGGLVLGGLYVFAQKMWIDATKDFIKG